MKYVSELYGRHPESDIYVVGTGASLRVFPKEFFRGRIVVGLNMAWKMVPVTYAITIHPDLNVPEFFEGEETRPDLRWIVALRKAKEELTPDQFKFAEETFYFFEYHGRKNTQFYPEPSDSGRIIEWIQEPTGNYLYNWSSISQAGVNLAANLGAANIILVGCDNCSLTGNHHSHQQHTRWKGADPDYRYRQYREGLIEVRAALRKRGVRLVSLTPFMGLNSAEAEFGPLCDEFGVPKFIQNQDVSPESPPPPGLKKRAKKYAKRMLRSLRQREWASGG